MVRILISKTHDKFQWHVSIRHGYSECAKCRYKVRTHPSYVNPLTPNDHYSGRTAPLNSKRCILYIYSTNIGTEYFKHGIYSPCFSLQKAVCFIILAYLVHVLFTFYIQGVLKLKNNSGAKRLISLYLSAMKFGNISRKTKIPAIPAT